MKIVVSSGFQEIKPYLEKVPLVRFCSDSDGDTDADYGFGMLGYLGGVLIKGCPVGNNYVLKSVLVFENKTFCFYKNRKLVEKVTFVIQGPEDPGVLGLACVLSLYGDVRVSTWNLYDFAKVKSKVLCEHLWNNQNVYYQIYTTLKGLEMIETEYAIKVRSDEFYPDWHAFLKAMFKEENTNKILCNNIFFRKIEYLPYHISDHIVGGLTTDLIAMFRKGSELIEANIPRHNKLFHKCIWCPEQVLTVAYYLGVKGLQENDLSAQHAEANMKNDFVIVPVEKMGDYKVCYSMVSVDDTASPNGERRVIRNQKLARLRKNIKVSVGRDNMQNHASKLVMCQSIDDV